jgi:hypothetical protein
MNQNERQSFVKGLWAFGIKSKDVSRSIDFYTKLLSASS